MDKLLLDIPTRFETERLIIRCYEAGDGPLYYAAGVKNRDHLQRYESGNVILTAQTEQEAEILVRELHADWVARNCFFMGAFDKETREFVAQVYVGVVNWDLPEFTIGYFADKDHEGQGFVTEAVQAALRFIFEHLRAHRVRLETNEMNTRSRRVAERCGFVQEGRLRDAVARRNPDGTFSGGVLYGMLRSGYEGLRQPQALHFRNRIQYRMEENTMSLRWVQRSQELGIERKQIAETLAATVRVTLKSRKDLAGLLDDLAQHIPRESIAGAPFCIIQFVTSLTDGYDAEIGFPVSQPVQAGEIKTRVFPPLRVLSLIHRGPVEDVRATYRKLYGFTEAHGLISDEFTREVYPDWDRLEWREIELQYVLHDWSQLFSANLERVLGQEASRRILQGVQPLTLESTLDERFAWSKEMMARLDRLASDEQKYDIVSSCAHIFPARQVDKLRAVYVDARSHGDDPIQAVDAVIEFMDRDPGWSEKPLREGRVIYSTKKPRDPQAHAQAQTDAEKRRAYCFCPVVRNRLDQGMSTTFCYCGSGWFRRQWEGALGKSVRIEIVKSIVKGDEVCQFAIHLPDDL